MTNIAELRGGASGTWSVNRKGDISDALFFTDPNGIPIALDGITFTAVVTQAGSNRTFFTFSTVTGSLQILAGGALVSMQGYGTGYVLGERFQIAGGTFVIPATLRVTGVGQTGGTAVAAVMDSAGLYTALPPNPAPQLVSLTGSGSGASVNLTYVNNALAFLVPQASIPGQLVAGTYSLDLVATADGMTVDVATIILTVI